MAAVPHASVVCFFISLCIVASIFALVAGAAMLGKIGGPLTRRILPALVAMVGVIFVIGIIIVLLPLL